jgi:porphobilinogen synthase
MTPRVRDLVAETAIRRESLMQPHFVVPGRNRQEEISSMPGIHRESIDRLVQTIGADLELGIHHVLLFGAPVHAKDARASDAYGEAALIPAAVRALRAEYGDALHISTDVCLCAYTDHGHCGVLEGGEILNDPSLELLSRMAVAHAAAGADMVAPSDMMDGRVAALRAALDEEGLSRVPIMSYAVKFASGYYGPFREAADSAPSFGDRKSYQMDYRNPRESVKEALLDVEEGADVLMVKPALAYLDVIAKVKAATLVPLAVYNVSGEYSMVKLAAQAGYVDERAIVLENLTAMVRAGADILITYHARDLLAKKWL